MPVAELDQFSCGRFLCLSLMETMDCNDGEIIA